MPLNPDFHPLPQDLEAHALGVFTRHLRFPTYRPSVYQCPDTWVEGSRCITLLFSARVNGQRLFAAVHVPPTIPPRVVDFASHTAASILNSRLRHEVQHEHPRADHPVPA